MYGEWLAIHQVIGDKLCYTFIYLDAWNHCQTVNAVQCSSSRVVVTHTLERILFLDLGLAVTEINMKKV